MSYNSHYSTKLPWHKKLALYMLLAAGCTSPASLPTLIPPATLSPTNAYTVTLAPTRTQFISNSKTPVPGSPLGLYATIPSQQYSPVCQTGFLETFDPQLLEERAIVKLVKREYVPGYPITINDETFPLPSPLEPCGVKKLESLEIPYVLMQGDDGLNLFLHLPEGEYKFGDPEIPGFRRLSQEYATAEITEDEAVSRLLDTPPIMFVNVQVTVTPTRPKPQPTPTPTQTPTPTPQVTLTQIGCDSDGAHFLGILNGTPVGTPFWANGTQIAEQDLPGAPCPPQIIETPPGPTSPPEGPTPTPQRIETPPGPTSPPPGPIPTPQKTPIDR